MDEPIDVVIVEDHPIFRRGLRAILEEPGTPPIRLLGEADTADAALALVEEHVPDVVIIDLQLNKKVDDDDWSGLKLISKVREISPHTQVLVLTAFKKNDLLLSALEAGANGYVFKTDDWENAEIRRALAMVARGEYYYTQPVLKRLHELLTHGSKPPLTIEGLTPREWEVLRLIAADRSNKEIADQLSISIKTVKTHVSNILEKLHLSSRKLAKLHYLSQQPPS
jgi:DNA-binding NarL/FixJ family response regulator